MGGLKTENRIRQLLERMAMNGVLTFSCYGSSFFVDLTTCRVDQATRLGGWSVFEEEEVLNDHNTIELFVHSRQTSRDFSSWMPLVYLRREKAG